jgi:hypothetical protein
VADRPFDEARSEAFAGRMMDVLNGAGIALMTSIGHQVGLFDAMAGRPPATSHQIAAEAELNERYVRSGSGRWSPAGWWTTTRPARPTRSRSSTRPG